MIRFKKKVKKLSLVFEDSADYYTAAKVTNSRDAQEVFRELFDHSIEHYESFFLYAMNRAGNTIGWAMISQGGISGTVVDTRLVFQYLLSVSASSFIVCHNHPSGNLKPSQEDIKLTSKLKKAGDIMNIKLNDHIILTAEGYYSMADNGDIY